MKRALLASMISMAFLAGCASEIAEYKADSFQDEGNPEAALKTLQAQLAKTPDDLKLRVRFQSSLLQYLSRLQNEGDQARARGDSALAISRYQQILSWETNNQRAQEGIRLVEIGVRHSSMTKYAMSIKDTRPDEALTIVNQILAENPRSTEAQILRNDLESRKSRESTLRPALAQALKSPISLQFRDQSMMSVFDIISRIGNVNFIFDKDVPPNLKTTIYARDTTVQDVINLILATNQLDKKILNENTILIYPKRPDKDRDYKDMVMRTFYLSNADPKQVLSMIKQMVKTRDVYIDERLSMLVMRDTPDAIAVAERLIAAQDIPQSEVLMEVEILEVSNSDMLDLGIKYPGSVSATVYGNTIGATPTLPTSPDGSTATSSQGALTAGAVTLDQLRNINSSDILVNLGVPTVTANFNQTKGKTNILANPKIRVKNRDKAKVLIGERVPVVTSTVSNGTTTENVNYQDVGLTLNVEPTLTVDNEISVKVSLEVSNITRTIPTKGGLLVYQIGTRRAETNMTSRDGETQVLAGLLSRQEVDSGSGIPFLSSVPGFDRIFGTKSSNKEKTELIMLITPRVIRSLPLPLTHITNFDSGTEGSMSIDALRLRNSSTVTINNQGGQPAPYTPPPAPQPTPVNEPYQQPAPVNPFVATPSPAPAPANQQAEPDKPAATPLPRNGGMGRR